MLCVYLKNDGYICLYEAMRQMFVLEIVTERLISGKTEGMVAVI